MQSTNPQASIIIPVYKVEPYIRRCLDSAINQTYTNLEIILVDDGSPDNCPQICDEYAKRDNRIKVIHKDNEGLSEARNVGTDIAKGEYIYYLDSDDELPLDAIESMIFQAQKYPNAEVIVGNMFCPQDNSLYKNQHFNEIRLFNNNAEFRKHFYGGEMFPINACNKLIQKTFITRHHLFFKKGIIHEDQLWMFHVSKVLNQAVCLNKITYIRHLNPGSIMTGTANSAKIQSWGIILKEIFSEINKPAFAEQFFRYFNNLNDFYSQVEKKNIPSG